MVVSGMPIAEVDLRGGRTTAGVVRIGSEVHRPQSANTPFVHRVLRHLQEKGFAGAPRALGFDEKGREVLSFLPGDVPTDLGAFTDTQCAAAARLLRGLHDATADFDGNANTFVVCHGDASPCNCVFREQTPVAFIDFDTAHLGCREEDVGYAAWLWLDIGNDDLEPENQGRRLAAFLAAYQFETTGNYVDIVLDAQRRAVESSTDPMHRVWAENCLAWTQFNQQRISDNTNHAA